MPAFFAPLFFLLIYPTGWIVTKFAEPHADPLTFLAVRYACSIAVLAPIALIAGARWPKRPSEWAAAMGNGVFLHGCYLGGVWWAIAHGVPAGVSALIAALQPVMTAVAAGPLLGERLDGRRKLGVALGFAGVAAVVAPKLGGEALGQLILPVIVNVGAMIAITAATLHQKKALVGVDLRALAPLQYCGALIATLPLAFLIEPMRFDPTPEALGALAWSVLALSTGAVLLMLAMIARGEVSRFASLLFLVPPIAVVQAYFLLGETLGMVQIVGLAVASAGVLLVNVGRSPASAEGCIAARVADDEDRGELYRRPA